MDQPVYTFAKWQVKEGQVEKVLALLTEVAQQSVREKGNLLYKIHQSHADQRTLLLYEAYTDAAAVEIHRQSDYFQGIVVGQIIPLLENREVHLATELQLTGGPQQG